MKLPYLLSCCGLALCAILSTTEISLAQSDTESLSGSTEVRTSSTCYAYDKPSACRFPDIFDRYPNDYWDKRNQQVAQIEFDRPDPIRIGKEDCPAWGSPYPFVKGPISQKEERIKAESSYKVVSLRLRDQGGNDVIKPAVDTSTPAPAEEVQEAPAEALEKNDAPPAAAEAEE